jgi:hypothetical protein
MGKWGTQRSVNPRKDSNRKLARGLLPPAYEARALDPSLRRGTLVYEVRSKGVRAHTALDVIHVTAVSLVQEMSGPNAARSCKFGNPSMVGDGLRCATNLLSATGKTPSPTRHPHQ